MPLSRLFVAAGQWADGQAELPQESILLSDDSGNPLSQGNKTLQSYGLTGDSTLFLTLTLVHCSFVFMS